MLIFSYALGMFCYPQKPTEESALEPGATGKLAKWITTIWNKDYIKPL